MSVPYMEHCLVYRLLEVAHLQENIAVFFLKEQETVDKKKDF